MVGIDLRARFALVRQLLNRSAKTTWVLVKWRQDAATTAARMAALLLLTMAGIFAVHGQQKEVAITVDDLPLNGPNVPLERLQKMTGELLAIFKKRNVPAVGFVNESLLYRKGETDERIAVLKSWVDGGFELGNHTFGHTKFADISLADFEDDMVRGDVVTRMLMKPRSPRYFRHPNLKMGATAELELAFRKFLAERGYKAAPVTIGTADWVFLSAYRAARDSGNKEELKRVCEEYRKFVLKNFDSAEEASAELFGSPIRHILLLHANELNAETLDEVFSELEKRGYRFITLERALEDPVYRFPEKYRDTSNWLSHWAFAKDKKLSSPAVPEFIQKADVEARKKQAR